jgi:hypothetical protein
MKHRAGVAMLPMLLACGGSGAAPETAVPAGPIEGIYEFVANLPNQQVRGTISVIGDTITVDPVSDHCRPLAAPPDPLFIKYSCQGTGSYEELRLSIDRRKPVQLSRWVASYRVTRTRQICIAYSTRNGQRTCVQTQTETYETTDTRTGNLQLRLVSPGSERS